MSEVPAALPRPQPPDPRSIRTAASFVGRDDADEDLVASGVPAKRR
jgi:hypothetical protein